MKLIHEHFNSINELLSVLSTRPNNAVMARENSSQKIGDKSWYGTDNWEDALYLLKTGYTNILPEIKKEMRIQNKKYLLNTEVPKRKPSCSPVGYTPNITNAINNLPNSMITIDYIPQKKKTLSLIYCIGGNCGEESESFIHAGVSLLTAINILEKKGIQTQLSIGFMASAAPDEGICPTVSVKNYNQKLNLQKLCFPIAHPAMHRRIGFKYLETCPELTNRNFAWGYGRSLHLDELIKYFPISNKNTKIINHEWIKNNSYDVLKIIDYFNGKGEI